jgi:hypothetical protein
VISLGPDPNSTCSNLVCPDGMIRRSFKLVGPALAQTSACQYIPTDTDLRMPQGDCTPYDG